MISDEGREKEMPKGRHTEAQIMAALQQVDAGRAAADVGREVGVSASTIYAWKAKYGGMTVSEAQEAKQLLEENARLKKMLADVMLDKDMLQSVIRKKAGARRQKAGPNGESLCRGLCGHTAANRPAGTVTLRWRRAPCAVSRRNKIGAFWLSGRSGCDSLKPCVKPILPFRVIVGRRKKMSLRPKVSREDATDFEKALRMLSRFETLHPALSLSRRLM
jgi:putative transposase